MRKIDVTISNNSDHAVADSQVEKWLETLLACQNDGDTTLAVVATHVQLNELRLAVKNKLILPFEFRNNGSTVFCDSDVNLNGNLEGLFDELNQQLIKLL